MSNISGGATSQMIMDWFSLKPTEKVKSEPRSGSKPTTHVPEPVHLYKFPSQYKRPSSSSSSDREYQFSNRALHDGRSQASDFAPINAPPPINKHGPSSPGFILPNMNYLHQDAQSTTSQTYSVPYSHQLQQQQQQQQRRHQSEGRLSPTMSDLTYLSGVTSFTRGSDISDINKLYGGVPRTISQPDDSRVFDRYSFDHVSDVKLPITTHRDQILNTIENHPVTVIQGTTGSGKTTQVPQYILEYHAQRGLHCNIVCTQPRKIAAISIAKRICQERKWQLGTLVGYHISMDRQSSQDTRLLFVTTGVLLQQLINEKNMHNYTHIIIDEVHERDLDTDFCMLVCKYFLQTNSSSSTKLILMSATFDASLFSNYFNVYSNGTLSPAPIITVSGKLYEVMEHYLNDLMDLSFVAPPNMDEPKLNVDYVHLAAKLINSFDDIEEREAQKDSLDVSPTKGTVLMFLPGLPEIMQTEAIISTSCSNTKIIPLHSTISPEDQQQIFYRALPGYRKVIIATNIAESSITVPDVRYVIDFCLVKQLIFDGDTNYQCLRIAWASKASLTQRKGRAGRVSAGRVYRMIQSNFYWDLFVYSAPEMLRCPLDRIILQTKVWDIGAPVEVLGMALETPNVQEIERTVLLLQEVGALTSLKDSIFDGNLTFLGIVCEKLPIDIRLGKLLLLGFVFGCLEECLVMASALSVRNFFSRLYRVEMKTYRSKVAWGGNTFSDPIAMLNAYRAWYKEKHSGKWGRDKDYRQEIDWCRRNFINYKGITETHELIKELIERLNSFNITSTRSPLRPSGSLSEQSHETLLLKLCLAGAFYPNYFRWSNVDEEEALRIMSGHDASTTIMVSGLPQADVQRFTSSLYKLFQECGVIKEIHYECSRAYIEFESSRTTTRHNNKDITSTGTTPILPAVYIALKMRQVEYNNFELRADDEENLSGQTNLNYRSPRSARQKHVKTTPPDPFPPHDTDNIEYDILIRVTEVVDPGHIWAQLCTEQTNTALDTIYTLINSNTIQLTPLWPLIDGHYCIALFPDDNMLYRARIDTVDYDRESVIVTYVDFGNRSELGFRNIYALHESVLNYPTQCIECFLVHIKPSYKESSEGYWSTKAIQYFNQIASDKVMFASVYSKIKGKLRIELFTLTEDYNKGISINQSLQDKEYALYLEEPLTSRVAHKNAKQVKKFSLKNLSSSLDEIANENNLIQQDSNSLVSHSSESSQVSFPCYGESIGYMPPRIRPKINKVFIRGPTSPYEVFFYSMSKVGRIKSTRIERDSVNSVVLNNEPQDLHERLMIAGFVSLNSKGSSVIARETVLMPNIHGLATLVPILFAPFVEFRTDESKRFYTGAICGLGIDSQNRANFPDRDVEITFDTKFDQEDLDDINAIRDTINISLQCDDSRIKWNQEYISKIQRDSRCLLLNLFLKAPKPSCTPCHFHKSYNWGLIKENDFRLPKIKRANINDRDMPPIFKLHYGVKFAIYDPSISSLPTKLLVLKERVEELKNKAGNSSIAEADLFCYLCNVNSTTPSNLSFHLSTTTHKITEKIFSDELNSYNENQDPST